MASRARRSRRIRACPPVSSSVCQYVRGRLRRHRWQIPQSVSICRVNVVFAPSARRRRRRGRAPPMRIEHLVLRPQVRRRVAVAVEAPAHVQCASPSRSAACRRSGRGTRCSRRLSRRGCCDRRRRSRAACRRASSVAGCCRPGSAGSGASIAALVQICEWQVMQMPVDGMPALARFLDRRVAIAAIDAEAADVVLVAERDRLLAERNAPACCSPSPARPRSRVTGRGKHRLLRSAMRAETGLLAARRSSSVRPPWARARKHENDHSPPGELGPSI